MDSYLKVESESHQTLTIKQMNNDEEIVKGDEIRA